VTPVGVQHHHAHVASLMAEHGLEGPILGLAYDGTGYGTDGTAWGGELLLAGYDTFERLATFRPLRLAGGDTAIRQVWRVAMAALLDAFDGEPPIDALPVFSSVSEGQRVVVRQLIEGRVNAPLAHGVGRYFDAFGALALARRESRFEGQVALELNNAADPEEVGDYPFDIEMDGRPWEVDFRRSVRAAVDDVLAGRGAGIVSARFHNTLVAASAALVREAVPLHGRLPVGLTGGCFQNPMLAERLAAALSGHGLSVHLHEHVPPGDGGISLGQAMVADAVTGRARV
jgi:hydrogenase maturation protein HypF